MIICLVLAVIVLLSACSTVESAPPPSATDLPATVELTEAPVVVELPATQEPDLYPFTYQDALGRSVTIDACPERIISLAPSITEMLYAIGAGEQVVGRTDYDNYPPEVEEVPVVGGFDSASISVETILNLEPDLVIGGSVHHADLAKTLEDAGITVIVVEPESIAAIIETMQTLGAITGHGDEADAAVAGMQMRINAVTEKIATIPENDRPLVFYEVWHEPLMTASNQTFIGELITLAGGINIFSDLEEAYPTISAEEIIEQNPDVILGPSSHGDQLIAEMIAARPGWASLAAVQDEAIYIVDGDIISRAGPRVVDALEAIAMALYPELFDA
ncbi:MAG: cobalamin-binding protein [Anaerolineae bacterium]|nr:cobalamin-binding protein [Anaerolineae bacterium]